MKIELQRRKMPVWRAPRTAMTHITFALPFFRSNFGRYTHRVRSGNTHWRDGNISHISLQMWCGQNGFPARGKMMDKLGDDSVMCATCEGRAIGAGMLGTREINGVPVEFSPRKF